MSTRTILEFRQGTEKIQIYQHSDGYPSWTLPEIERFLKWNDVRNGDLRQTSANFVLFGKLSTVLHFWLDAQEKLNLGEKPFLEEYAKPFDRLFFESGSNFSSFHTGYSIEPIPMNEYELCKTWIEWFYRIELPEFDTFHNKDYKIKISVYVPTNDTLKKIGSLSYDHKTKKLTDMTAQIIKEMDR